ncbi:LysR family transcriptional regulator [Dictyobacter aurantiacus]|uniref:LysR family transcriptional regulator n=1 Tax=Dictyobacter aurantiacus TaxID=1936993 RepID=A0A401ZLT0_9CHLR|nr:LysR family transcriptional regulator [Dictyobacter aurantiacus]GCE07815.1 LysR family transcriptional regulator [Dictyobacter aurantiacus]
MNFSQLQCFVALAETGSFTEAAYSVNLTQSAVSHALSTLEGELGVILFERSRRGGVALTQIGEKMLSHVRVILSQTEAIKQEAKEAHGEAAGKLCLGSIPSVCPRLLAGVLTRFRAEYPDIEVVLFEGKLDEVYEWIVSGTVDVGLVLHPAKEIKSVQISTSELYVIVPPGHRLYTQGAVTLRELREEPFIMPRVGCAFLQLAGLEWGRTGPTIRYHASDTTTILAMVREGLGISLLPRMMLPEKMEGIALIPLAPPRYMQLGFAIKSQDLASPGAKWFMQTASAWAQEQASLSSSAIPNKLSV